MMDFWTEVFRAATWTVTVVIVLCLLLIMVNAIDEAVTRIERWWLRRNMLTWWREQGRGEKR